MKQLFKADKRFYKANFHLHTTMSDGRRTPDEAIALYRAHGYDILAVTDHWKVSKGTHATQDGMLVLGGAELDSTLPGQVVHIVGLGLPEGFDALSFRGTSSAQQQIDAIRACGGRAILAHTAWSLNTPELIASLENVTMTEAYNTMSGLPWNGARADSTGILDVTFTHKKKLLPLCACDDTHFYTGEQCRSFTMVQAEDLSWAGVRKALDEGLFFASQGPMFKQITLEGDTLRVSCEPCQMIVFYTDCPWSKARVRSIPGQTEAEYALTDKDAYVRVELIDANGNRAWSSPIAR